MEHDFTKYLSDAAMNELSLALKSDDDDTRKTAFILKDGTSILIEGIRNKEEEKYELENPYEIKVSCRSMIHISYKDKDNYEGSTWIKAKSNEDLRKKWIYFCGEHGIGEDVVGTIDAITYTSEQSIVKTRLLKSLNDFVNTITDTNVDIFKYSNENEGEIAGIAIVDDEIKDRYDILYSIIGTITGFMLNTGMVKKLHIPSTIISADFLSKNPRSTLRATEIKEYFYRGDAGNFIISPCQRIDDDDEEDDDEDFYE